MSRRFTLSDPASQDFDEIVSYVLEQSGLQRAQHVADHLYEAFQKLAEMPGLGHKREDLTSLPVRFYEVWSYLVIYKPETRPLEVVRILHGARDVEALLGEAE
ncbi:MAG: type II toxin-antitoxin system RelE/ParE family toxin [Planctomycetes bacterium]|nr:type II toxin-antitoxin system RelE/ParE family toxin [Planctomycetota bacterium]